MNNRIDSLPPPAGRMNVATERAERAGSDPNPAIGAAAPVAAVRADEDTRVSVTAPPAGVPFDEPRIQALRAAIADGSYRVDPMEIASRLAALERELKS